MLEIQPTHGGETKMNLRKKTAGLLAIPLAFSLVMGSAASASTTVDTVNVVSTVNFRTAPSTSGQQIRYLRAGETLLLLDQPNNYWLHAQDSNGVAGYVSASAQYVSVTHTFIEDAPTYNGVVLYGVSFRTGPTTSADRMRYLHAGEQVNIKEKVNAYWYKLEDADHVVGYASTDPQYIQTSFVAGEAETEDVDVDPLEQEDADQWVPNAVSVGNGSFRTGPSTNDSRIRYLKVGEPLYVLTKVNAYWYKVQDQSGIIGYVSTSAQYIQTDYVEPYKLMTRSGAAQLVIDAGKAYLGTPYEFGSDRNDTSTFDCSDFVRQAFRDGIQQVLPADSRSQAAFVQDVGAAVSDWHQLQPGDLMFFMSYKGSKASSYAGIDKTQERVTHVGIYLGNGKVLHTYSPESGGVRIDSFEGTAWEYRFLMGGPTF
jgi:cell wall-associated NlpC family hydrolase